MRHWRYKSLTWDYTLKRWQWQHKKKPPKHVCLVRGCTAAAELIRTAKNKLRRKNYCWKCYRRMWRSNNPLRHVFSELRHSAFRRKIPFDLHYGEFLEFCIKHDFYNHSPKFTKNSLTIDRINPLLGYTILNIRVLTMEENSKANRKWQLTQQGWQELLPITEPEIDEPF